MHTSITRRKNSQDTYNGWTNKETWLVSLWLHEDPYTQEMLVRISSAQKNMYERVADIQAHIEDSLSRLELEASLWTDLLSTVLTRVDWYEIVEANVES